MRTWKRKIWMMILIFDTDMEAEVPDAEDPDDDFDI